MFRRVADVSRTITWVHLSDLHAGKPGMGWDARRVIETLVGDLKKMESDHDLHPDFIFFTGDAAFGQIGTGPHETLAGQFALAQEFFDAVRGAFKPKVRRSRLFFVPGNHDVNRQVVGADQTYWLDNEKDPYQIYKLMEKGGPQWQRYMERLAEYRMFLEDKGYSHLLSDAGHLVYGVVRNVAGVKVGIGGFNSAWSCCRDSSIERGKLWMGGRWQLEQMWSRLTDAGITIALFHHPANWLVEPEDAAFRRELEWDFKFILHGHEHQEWVTTGFDGWTRIAAAACYERSDKENGYNFVRLDLDTGDGQVWLRKYDDTGGEWIPRVIGGKTTNEGLWQLEHLKWLKPEPGPSTAPAIGKSGDGRPPSPAESVAGFDQIREAYYDYLKKELKDHTIRGFSPQVSSQVLSLPISDIFLPLQAVEGRPALAEYAKEDLRLQAARDVMGELDWQRRLEVIEKRYAQLSARRAAQRHLTLAGLLKEPRSVLLGDPGTGKTTTAQYVTYALAAGDTTHTGESIRGLTPVLIRIANYARAYEQDRTLHLVEYVETELTPKAGFGRFLRWAIENGRCLIILDGLDEVGNVSLRTEVTDRIQQMVAGFSDNRFMVTSRIVGYERSPLTQEFKHATLRELTPADRERFVQLWYDAIRAEIGGSTRAEGADDLIAALRAKPQIARLAANPLLLTIIVLMHWRGVKLPNRRVQVYQIATDTLVEYWTAQRGVAELDAEEVKGILAPIARYILSSNVAGVIAHSDLLPRFYQEIALQHGCDRRTASRIGRRMLKNLNEQSGLFLERGLDADGQPVYGFLHQTFGEYLAGLCLAEEAQSGAFGLEKYAHRSVWHEPLLLMAGHLSIYSKPQANVLVREILAFDAPYEEMLQRNGLLAADCLADDVQVAPRLRDEVLEKLAGLLGHKAPQVRDAALERYGRLAVTRHREAAVAALKHTYPLDCPDDLQVSDETRFHLATALVRLKETETARPILWPLEGQEYNLDLRDKARRLRFEGWPEQAADYMLQLQADEDYGFSVSAESDLAGSTLGPVDAGLARRVLGEAGLLDLIEKLADCMSSESDRAALGWLAAITPASPADEALVGLTAPEAPPRIRRLAATRLLEGEHRAVAVAVLRGLAGNESVQAPAAVQVLLDAGEWADFDRGLLRDTALMADDRNAPQAIAALLQIGDKGIALPAALHLMATRHPHPYAGAGPLWAVAESLLENDRTREVGLAAARWLALRPGYGQRIKACEALLEAGRVEEAIPLLQYLAYECHDEACQRACGRLLMLREAGRAVPILARVAQRAAPALRYQACLALALANYLASEEGGQFPERSELKKATLNARTEAYRRALDGFRRTGLEALSVPEPENDQARAAQALGRVSLSRMGQSAAVPEQEGDWQVLVDSPLPAAGVNVALLDLRAGRADRAQQRLAALLKADGSLSLPVRRQAVKALGGIVGSGTTGILITALSDKDGDVRYSAAEALGSLGDPAAVKPLIAALSDKDSDVRYSAAYALGSLGDPAVKPLITALSDKDSDVRYSAAEALGSLGDPAAVKPLITALSDKDSDVRYSAADALGSLGDPAAVKPLITALSDKASSVRSSAAEALGSLGDPAAVKPLITALSDEASDVRSSAARALGRLGDPAVQPLITALSDKDSSVRSSAADALRRLGDPAAVKPLITALSDEDGFVRSSAAYALGMLGDPAAVEPLVTALSDEARDVRHSAASALGRLGDPTAVELLITALSDEASDVRSSAARALGSLGDPAAVKPLVIALSDEASVVRRSAAEALGRPGDPAAVKPLITALSDKDSDVRRSAADALGRLGDPAAVKPLITALSDKDSLVRRSAASALGRLGDPAAVQPLIAALSDKGFQVGWSAAEALSQLMATEAVPILVATSTAEYDFEAQGYARALTHLDPGSALPVLERYARQFRRQSWVPRLRGQALWRLGDLDAALANLKEAVEREDDSTNLLALAHFYLEEGELETAGEQVRRALEKAPRGALCLLSRAVLLWERGEIAESLEYLAGAQQKDWPIIRAKDMAYGHFWGPKALAAVETMLAQSAAGETATH